MVKTKTTKKVSKGCPEGQVPDGKGGCMPKPKIVKIVKPTADSTAWKNRTLPNLTEQGLDYEIGRLSKMVTPKSAPSIIQQKIDMLKREKIRRTTVKKVTTNKKK